MKLTSSALNSLILGREEFSFVPSRPIKEDDIVKEIDLLETADDDKPGCIVLAKGLDVLAADALNLRLDCKPKLITVSIVLMDLIYDFPDGLFQRMMDSVQHVPYNFLLKLPVS